MKNIKGKFVTVVLVATVAVMGLEIINIKEESNYYHTLHNRQTWMIQLLDDESTSKLAEEIDKNMEKDTDEILRERYKHMDYRGQK